MGYGIALLAFTVLATATSTYVAYQGQQYQKQVAKDTSRYNAKLQENQAIQSDMEARENIARERAKNRRFMASQNASIAKSGVTVAGSPLEVLGETAGQLELQNQDYLRASDARRRLGMSAASNTLIEGAATAKGLELASTGTLISGAAQMASEVGSYQYNAGKKSA